MGALWVDRLVEVWAAGTAGAGVLAGTHAVLTARHVIAGALVSGRVLARVVRPHTQVGVWVPMTVPWDSAEWDLALLTVDRSAQEASDWLTPDSSAVVVAALGTDAEPGCEAVGFPDAVVQPAADGAPSSAVRQSEQVRGVVLAAGQGKPPKADRPLPALWMPLDADTDTPGAAEGWQGMSGAPVVLPAPDGRLVGLVVAAETSRQRRLYLVPLAAAQARERGLAAALANLAGAPMVVEARHAPAYRDVLQKASLGADGLPYRIHELGDSALALFGVKPADVPSEPTYLNYVPRDQDGLLRDEFREAVAGQQMLLVVGGSAAGKSRSAAEAVRAELPGHRLLRPQFKQLQELIKLPLTELGPSVVWLDDIDRYSHRDLAETLRRLLDSGLAVVATIRFAQLQELAKPGDLRDPAGDALTDDSLVRSVDWPLAWSGDERARLAEHVHDSALLAAAANGVSPSVYSVAGPDLLKEVRTAKRDETWPWRYPLIRAVLDWHRTGLRTGLPVELAPQLMAAVAGTDTPPPADEVDDALVEATRPVLGGGRKTRQAVLIRSDPPNPRLEVHDYVLDHDQRTNTSEIPRAVWDAALTAASDESDRIQLGISAAMRGPAEVAGDALFPLALDGGSADAQYALGVLFAQVPERAVDARRWLRWAARAGHTQAQAFLGQLLELDPPDLAEARHWYEQAAGAGDTDAQYHLGLLLGRLGPPELVEARRWLTAAAEAGHIEAQFRLGLLLGRLDPPQLDETRRWLTAAAEAGHIDAQYALGLLLITKLDPPELAEARRWLTAAAEAGNTDAQYNLGVLLANRLDPPQLAEARRWLTAAAQAEHPRAQNSVGELLIELDPPELAEARRWLTAAAQAGNTDAQYNLGVLLANRLDPPQLAEARHWYEQAARAGHAAAWYALGVVLANRLDPPELVEARHWLEQAARAEYPTAQYALGVLLATQLDPPELEEARHWLEQAAEAGNTDAQYHLGLLLGGWLDPPELAEARRWLTAAAQAGHTDAQYALGGLLATELDPPELAEARRWLTAAAQAGHTDACWLLGKVLAYRLNPPELDEARHWLTAAAQAGHTDAQSTLGVVLATEVDPPQLEEARRWLTAAAQAEDPLAQANLGELLATYIDPPELDEARHWLTAAAQAEDTDAQYNLGVLLATQLDPPELADARHWFEQAAEAGNTDAQYRLGLLLAELDPPELDQARHWLDKAARAGHEASAESIRDLQH